MQIQLAGRVGALWSLAPSSPSKLYILQTAVRTHISFPGSVKGRPARLMESKDQWVSLRCASQEAVSERDLGKKKCIPCETGKLQPLSTDVAHSMLSKVPGWEIQDIDGVLQLNRSWKAKSFVKGLEILKKVADVAEAEGHHPDLHLVNWNQLSINISTHAVGGLTENDFILAAKLSALDLTEFVRKPKVPKEPNVPPAAV